MTSSQSSAVRVLILSGVRGDTRRYRSFHPYEQLRLAGVDCVLSHITDPSLFDKVKGASVILMHRVTYDTHLARLVDLARKQKSLIILDVDDLTFDINAFNWIDSPDFQDPIRAALYKEDLCRNRQALDLCDAVLASTETLYEQIRKLGKPVWIHRNAFSFEMLAFSEKAYRLREQRSEKLIIGYASGTPTHNRDFGVVKPVLQQLLCEYPQVELKVIGHLDLGHDWGDLKDRVKFDEFVPWRQLPSELAQFDINLAPLVVDNPFAQSKSEIKYVEAGLLRVPTVASRTNAFNVAISNGENGFLASQEQDWCESIRCMIDNQILCIALGQRAYEDIMKRYHPVTRAKDLVETLDQISTQVAYQSLWSSSQKAQLLETLQKVERKSDQYWSSLDEEQAPTYFRMGVYNLKHRGLTTLLKRVWVFFRRGISPLFPYKIIR